MNVVTDWEVGATSTARTHIHLDLGVLTCEGEHRIATALQPGTAELRLVDGDHEVLISPGDQIDGHILASAEALLTAVTVFVAQLRLHDQPGRYVSTTDQS